MIRSYRDEDLPRVAEMVRAGVRLDKATISRRLASGKALVFDDEGIRAVGVVGDPYSSEEQDRMDLWLYVAPHFRRMGIGKRLFDRLFPGDRVLRPTYLEAGYRCDEGDGRRFFRARGFARWFTLYFMRYSGRPLPEPSLEVRPPAEEWLDAYFDLVNRSFYSLRRAQDMRPFAPYPAGSTGNREIRRAILDRESSFLFFEEGELIGIGETDGRDFIDLVAVHPDRRRRGYGRAITAYCVNRLLARGCRTVVTAVLEINTAARRLYESMGFQQFEVYEEARVLLRPHGDAGHASGEGVG